MRATTAAVRSPSPPVTEGSHLKTHVGHIQSLCLESSWRIRDENEPRSEWYRTENEACRCRQTHAVTVTLRATALLWSFDNDPTTLL